VVSDLASSHYWSFMKDTSAPRPRRPWLWDSSPSIEDIDDGWRRTLVHSWNDWLSESDEDDLVAAAVAAHPTLVVARGGAGGGLSLVGPQPASPMRGLSRRQRRRLVRQRPFFALVHVRLGAAALVDRARADRDRRYSPLRPVSRPNRRRLVRQLRRLTSAVHWYNFASAPPHWWTDRARAEADSIRSDVAKVFGRPPVDDFETADVLMNRNDEILVLNGDAPFDHPEPPETWKPPDLLCSLVENALLPRGWRLEHPAVRGVLIGPDGEHMDIRTMVTPDPPGWNLNGLRAVLRPMEVEGRADPSMA
jgi:hypothetical protein